MLVEATLLLTLAAGKAFNRATCACILSLKILKLVAELMTLEVEEMLLFQIVLKTTGRSPKMRNIAIGVCVLMNEDLKIF